MGRFAAMRLAPHSLSVRLKEGVELMDSKIILAIVSALLLSACNSRLKKGVSGGGVGGGGGTAGWIS